MSTFTAGQSCVLSQMTRRNALRWLSGGTLAALASGPAEGASHFWDTKPPSQWTPEEIAQLTTNSPWAKQTAAQYRVAMEDYQPRREGQPTQGRGEATVGECGLVPCGNIMPGTVIVIWEGAQPIRDALHAPLPPELNGRYILSIRGLETDLTAERLKQGSELSAKGKPPVLAGVVSRRNNTLLFGFSREILNLEAGDKDVQFTLRTGPNFTATLVRASFNPKDMIYRGALAL